MPSAMLRAPAAKPIVKERPSPNTAAPRDQPARAGQAKVVVGPPTVRLMALDEKGPQRSRPRVPAKASNDVRKEVGLRDRPPPTPGRGTEGGRPVGDRQGQPLQQGNLPVQVASPKTPASPTSPASASARPAAGVTSQRPPSESSGQNAPPGVAVPALDPPRAGGGEVTQGDSAGASSLARITGAAQSSVQAQAIAQANLINNNCLSSESHVTRLAATRRQQTSAFFSATRRGLSAFFTTSIARVQNFIAGKQAELAAAAARAVAWVRTAVMGTLQSAQAVGLQIRARINQTTETLTTSVQSRVEGIANQITGIIDSIPLPDLPGMGWIRGAAVSLLNSAAGAINSAFGVVLGFIRSALNAGLSLLDSFISGITRAVEMALSLALSAIQSLIQMIAQALTSAVGLFGSILQQAVLAVALPIINRVESGIIRLIGSAEQRALAMLRANRNQYLNALADATAPGDESAPAQEAKGAHCDPSAAMQQLGRDAIQNNRMIVQTLELVLGGAITAVIRIVAATAALVVARITALVAQGIQFIASAVTRAIQTLAQMLQAIGNFVSGLLQGLISALGRLAEYVRSAVQAAVDKVIQFAQNGLSRIGSFIRTFVSNLVLGRGVSGSVLEAIGEFNLTSSLPAGAPALSFLGPAPAFAGPPIQIIGGLLIILYAGLTLVMPVWLAVLIVVVVILLLILLLYLLWRWLKKPKKPKPCPCTIVTKTLVSAPDGTADTRSVVGVNERVEMTCSTASKWSANRGTVSPVIGLTTIWTAPARRASCTIKAVPTAGAKPCKVKMSAIEPSANHQTISSRHAYTPGLAGSGFVGDVVLLPTKVAFSRLETREDTVNAKATGYYDTVLNWNGIPHPPGSFAPVDSNNGEGTDTVGTVAPGTAPPFSKGRFSWPIPQLYRILGGSAEIKYSTGHHVQEMTGATGEETTSKEGASNNRTP